MNFLRKSAFGLLATCFLAVLSAGIAQAKDDHWRQPSAAELAQKTPVVEADADAEYLLFESKIDNSDGLEISHYVRIKIFTDRGREKFAKIDIPPLLFAKLKDVAARVIRPDGSIRELKKDDIFERTIVKVGDAKIKARSFAVPNIEPGVIIEYRYREVFPNVLVDLDLFFQREVPTQNATYLVKPSESVFKLNIQRFNMPNGVDFVDDQDGFRRLTMVNVPAQHVEPMMPPSHEVRPWLMLYYSREVSPSLLDFWGRFGAGRGAYLAALLEPNVEVKRVADEITAGAATPEEKVNRIFDYCQSKIKNLTYDTEMKDEEKALIRLSPNPAETLKSGRGWHEDIDRLFVALTGAAGLGPKMAYTGDRNRLALTPQRTNSRLVFFAGVAFKLNDNWVYFDPGSKFLSPGMLAWTAEGQDALLVNTTGFLWTRTALTAHQRSVEKRTGKFRLSEDGTLEGEVRLEYSGQLAEWRKSVNYDDPVNKQEETLRDEMKTMLPGAEITEIKLEHVNEPKVPFAYTFKLKMPGYAQKTGTRLLFQPGVFEHGSQPLFTASERRFDIVFHYPWSEEDNISIELPAGFSAESPESPAPITPEFTQGVCGLTIQMGMQLDQRTLVFHRSFFFGDGGFLFPRSSYPALKQLFENVHQADTHSIAIRRS